MPDGRAIGIAPKWPWALGSGRQRLGRGRQSEPAATAPESIGHRRMFAAHGGVPRGMGFSARCLPKADGGRYGFSPMRRAADHFQISSLFYGLGGLAGRPAGRRPELRSWPRRLVL